MPELAEVEVLKRQLNNIVNKKILNIELSDKKLRFNPSESILKKFLKNEHLILNIYRRNKYLILDTNDFYLIFHLGMSGQLICGKTEKNHNHVKIFFNDDILNYIDPRRFGGFDIIDKNKISNYLDIPIFKNIGIEPFSKEYNKENVYKIFKNNPNLNIKKFLLDQKFICGLGNIYANEIMFLAKINPNFLLSQLSNNQKIIIFNEIPKLLQKAIDLGGSTISDFTHTNGNSGQMQNFYNVYSRDGKLCKICNSKIEKIIQNNRSTYFCINCQS